MVRTVICVATVAAICMVIPGCGRADVAAPESAMSRPTKPPLSGGISASEIAGFVGSWSQHAGAVEIRPDGSVDMAYQVQDETGSEFPSLRLKIVSVTDAGATARVISSDDPAVTTGSVMILRRREPGLVVLFPSGAERWWCDRPHADQGDCGA